MFVLADAGAVAVVIELDQFGSPPQKHGMPRRQKQVHGGEQSIRPCIDGPDGSLAPIKTASQLGHFAIPKNSGWFIAPWIFGGGTGLGHGGQRPAKGLGTRHILLLWKAIREM